MDSLKTITFLLFHSSLMLPFLVIFSLLGFWYGRCLWSNRIKELNLAREEQDQLKGKIAQISIGDFLNNQHDVEQEGYDDNPLLPGDEKPAGLLGGKFWSLAAAPPAPEKIKWTDWGDPNSVAVKSRKKAVSESSPSATKINWTGWAPVPGNSQGVGKQKVKQGGKKSAKKTKQSEKKEDLLFSIFYNKNDARSDSEKEIIKQAAEAIRDSGSSATVYVKEYYNTKDGKPQKNRAKEVAARLSKLSSHDRKKFRCDWKPLPPKQTEPHVEITIR